MRHGHRHSPRHGHGHVMCSRRHVWKCRELGLIVTFKSGRGKMVVMGVLHIRAVVAVPARVVDERPLQPLHGRSTKVRVRVRVRVRGGGLWARRCRRQR